ncbi:MAG: sulfatase-like hydrolase/transferase, partial [Betaproteobacteria bacterium]
MRQPNILWICTDQQRWDTLSCRGYKGAVTPNIDALAATGVLFDRAYCQSTVCTPSRTSFLTGTYPIANQVQRNGNDLFPDHHLLVTRIFEEAGYHTGLIGKLHLSRANGVTEKRPAEDGYKEFYWSHHPDPDWDEGHDYHRWLEQKGIDAHAIYDSSRSIGAGVPADVHQTTWAGETARSFVERSRDKPWFLSINLFDPHPPFDPPAEYLARFDAKDMPAPAFMPGDIAHQRSLEAVDHQSRDPFDPRLGDPDSELCIAAPLEVKTDG